MMNNLHHKIALIILMAIALAGCASSQDEGSSESQVAPASKSVKIDAQNSNNNFEEKKLPQSEAATQANRSDYRVNLLESARLLELKAEIDTELSKRNLIAAPSTTGEIKTARESSATKNEREPLANQAANSMLVNLADTPSPNQEMALDLQKLGVFNNLSQELNLLKPITRGEYITLLYYANNAVRSQDNHIRLAPASDPGFTDINSQHPAYKYVQAFAHSGHSVGYPDKTFKPDRPITREEMIGIKEPLDAGTPNHTDRNVWRFNDFEQIDPKFYRFIYIDHFLKKRGKGSNIQRAFGNIKSFKPKEPVLGYEAIGSVWQFGGYRMTTETAADIK